MFGNRSALERLATGARNDISPERIRRIAEMTASLRSAPVNDPGLVESIEALASAIDALKELRRLLREAAEPVIAASSEADVEERYRLSQTYIAHRDAVTSKVERVEELPDLLQAGDGELSIGLPRGLTYRISRIPLESRTDLLTLPLPEGAFREHDEVNDVMMGVDRTFAFVDHSIGRLRRDHDFLTRHLHDSPATVSNTD